MQPLHPPTRHFRAALWVLCAAALLLQLGLHSGALQDGWSHAQLDWLIRQRAQRQTANPNLVIIDIDDTSLQVLSEEAGKWPWPRSLHAELLEYLLPQQPKAVVFDLLFSEPDRYRPDADAYLAEVLGQSERVYLAALEQQPAEQSLAPLLSSYPAQTGLTRGAQADPEQRGLLLLPQALPPALWRLGSINFRADPDGVGRRYELYRSFGDWRLPSLPARVARDLGATLPEGSSFLLDWPSASRLPYPRITYAAALAQARGQVQTVAADYYADKVVLIGTTASGLHDLRRTPLDELYPAVFILGTALDNLLRGQHLRQLPALPTGLLGLPVLLGLAALLLHEKLLGALLLSLAGSLLLLVGSYALVLHGWLLSTVPTLLSLWLLLGLAQVLFYWRRRQQLQNTIGLFSRFLDPVVVAQLVALEDPRALLESRECQITV
ncbi:MAG TPA: CHASE2 domain-containing protein, partial [Pseudomonas sp.]|nr:CHASE2 domain-containing protein [Pseudomonas sp.]